MKQAWYIADNDGFSCTIRDAADHDEDGDGMVCEQATPDDARLIVAAPDLLVAAQQISQFIRDRFAYPTLVRNLMALEAAIDKANGTAFGCVDGEHGCYSADRPCGCPCDNCHDDTEFRCKVCNTIVASIRNSTFYLASTDAPTETVPDRCEDCANPDPRDEPIGHEYHREIHQYLVEKGEREE